MIPTMMGQRIVNVIFVVSLLLLLLLLETLSSEAATSATTTDNDNNNSSNSSSSSPWRFLLLSDWHNSDIFIFGNSSNRAIERANTLKVIHDKYGPGTEELVVLPGDCNTGHWYGNQYHQKYIDHFGSTSISPKELVLEAGKRAYNGMINIFQQAGYNNLLMTVGDHELGDDPWHFKSIHTPLISTFREAYTKAFFTETVNTNTNTTPSTPPDGQKLFKLKYSDPIGDAPSRPWGTPYEGTSFAYQHKNVLFVTVDVFHTMIDDENYDYFDKSQGVGGSGIITMTLVDDHLQWFENVLIASQNEPTINHIIVQGHVPILQPVRKVHSSGLFLDYADESDMWKLMREYNVDIYFAGEVHSNTVTQDSESNLLQVVTRGNSFNNFGIVDITSTTIELTLYNEIGNKANYNMNYTQSGYLKIDKSKGEDGNTIIESNGELEILDLHKPLLKYDFEFVLPLVESRQVLALKHDDISKTSKATKITIRDQVCTEAIWNQGSMGAQYDAQVCDVSIIENGKGIKGNSGLFTNDSRMGISGYGPHSGGHIVSYSIWIKTSEGKNNEMVLFSYVSAWVDEAKWIYMHDKHIFTLTLQSGRPTLIVHPNLWLQPKHMDHEDVILNNDNQWHHIVVSMPTKSCLLSEVDMYVDGNKIETQIDTWDNKDPNPDDHLFMHPYGLVGIGGFGHAGHGYEEALEVTNYIGEIDEAYMYGRTLSEKEVKHLYESGAGLETAG